MNNNGPHPEARRRRVSKDDGVGCTDPSFETLDTEGPQDEVFVLGSVEPKSVGWTKRSEARDTIFALSTPPGRSAVAVIRLSGPGSAPALASLTGKRPKARFATLAKFCDPATGDVLDKGLALLFPAPGSFTGEDCAEIHLHGSMAAVRAVQSVLAGQPGLREARPGEFTRRALDNGKLDLAQAEALADLVDAQTERQRRLALAAADAGPARFASEWRDQLVDAIAAIDAELDFSDEGDVGALAHATLSVNVRALHRAAGDVISAAEKTRKIRDGYVVAICGPPNSGKSSLLNALIGREQAIVSPHAGTTRDLIEVSLDLGGLLVTLVDTAGIRKTSEPVEQIGIARARAAAARADLTLWLTSSDADAAPARDLKVDIRIVGKADLGTMGHSDLEISAKTGLNLDRLIDLLRERAERASDNTGDPVALRDRHIVWLKEFGNELASAASRIDDNALEIAAAHLHGAADILTSLDGQAIDDAVLDRIFGRFCIGK